MEKNNEPKILAIETSCDETAAAVLIGAKIKSNIIYSQLNLHKKTKGIVPEVASRAHIEKIILVIKQALQFARVRPLQIDVIAVTVGPGLIGSLLVGVDTAKTLAYIFQKPIISVNHIEGHIYANFVGKLQATSYKLPTFPAIALVVSGGHTSLILMRGHGNYELLGSTLDDAAGEAFDKVAKILNLGYPGGPAISNAVSSYKLQPTSYKLKLPRPMIDSDNFNFSFSGLKTAVLYKVREFSSRCHSGLDPESINKMDSCFRRNDMAAEFQQAVVDVLVTKTIKAARKYNAKSVMIGGGVAANKLLRRQLRLAVKKKLPASCFLFPALSLCTDNAAMIGLCAYYKYLTDKNNLQNWQKIKINLNPKL